MQITLVCSRDSAFACLIRQSAPLTELRSSLENSLNSGFFKKGHTSLIAFILQIQFVHNGRFRAANIDFALNISIKSHLCRHFVELRWTSYAEPFDSCGENMEEADRLNLPPLVGFYMHTASLSFAWNIIPSFRVGRLTFWKIGYGS